MSYGSILMSLYHAAVTFAQYCLKRFIDFEVKGIAKAENAMRTAREALEAVKLRTAEVVDEQVANQKSGMQRIREANRLLR